MGQGRPEALGESAREIGARVIDPGSSEVPALVVHDLTKSYGEALVLDEVALEIGRGEVHALLGENGAGKSTLIKIVAGVVTPDGGTVAVAGWPLHVGSPQASMALGVSTLFQELATVPGLSVAENVFLGHPTPSRLGIVDRGTLERGARALFARLGQDIDVRRDAATLSPVERTMTALARALSHASSLLILDEPTAALTDAETTDLFAVIGRLRAAGTAILYVSHRLEEVFTIADRLTVLRNGRVVLTGPVAGTTVPAIITAMAGRPIDSVFPHWTTRPMETVLEVSGLTGRRIRDVSFDVRAGEVLGVAGLAGSGRSELVRILGGAQRRRAGRMRLAGLPYAPRSPGDAHRSEVAVVPQERRSQALVPDSVERNLTLTTVDARAMARTVVVPGRERTHARALWAAFGVRGHGIGQDVLTLSGGNQQKVVLAMYLALRPRVLLLDEPTRGVDVATKSEVYLIVRAQAEAGCAVVVVSSELPEIMGLSDRIVVLHEGRVSGRFDRGEATEDELLHRCYGRTA